MSEVVTTVGPVTDLAEYAEIPIRFEVSRVLVPVLPENGLEGIILEERVVEPPYVKDYDACESPERWGQQWDLSNWGMITATCEGKRVGGCLIAHDTDGVHMLEGRKDLNVLWDIRIAPGFRGHGIGTDLFQKAIAWSRQRGCRAMNIETQNNNVPACRFYTRQGCVLRSIKRFAYPELPEEVQLIWHKEIV
jgi:GNAT superfamily N-acetyltransferase